MTVLVTGATGYVGARLCSHFAETNADVRALVRKRSGFLDPRVRQFEGDVMGDPLALAAACEGVSCIVHLAAPNETIAAREPERALAEAVVGTRRMAEMASRAGVKRFVYLSSIHVYGQALADDAHVTEETLPIPIGIYGASRLAAEHVARITARNVEVVALRLTNAVGALAHEAIDRWELVGNDLCRQAVCNGTIVLKSPGVQFRDFITMADVCRLVAGAATAESRIAGTYNLGSGRSMTILELAALVQEAVEQRLGFRPTIVAPEASVRPRPYRVSVESLAKHGLRAAETMTVGIGETVQFCIDRFEPCSRKRDTHEQAESRQDV